MATNEPNEDKKLLPWMPYVFGFILLLGFCGLLYLFTQKHEAAPVENVITVTVLPEEIVQPLKSFLEDIRSSNFKEAYGKASSDFKISMSSEKFSRFINTYDSLREWSDLSFSNPQIGKSIASVVAYLHFEDREETLPITFTLIHEEGHWKVYGFILNRADETTPIAQIEELKDLLKVVNQDLAYLYKENTMSSYYKMTTKRYQEENPYESYVHFIEETHIFYEQQGATLLNGRAEKNSGKVRVSLASDEEVVPVEFSLALEEGKWKIDDIKILAAPAATPALNEQEMEDALAIIQPFLENLRDNAIGKAYHLFTSRGFQKVTSLKLFQAFLEDHPILKENIEPRVIDTGREDDTRVLYLVYHKIPYSTSFEVKMVPEREGWKIQEISLETPEAIESPTIEKGEAIDMIQSVLNLLHSGSNEKFYEQVASMGFRQTTSYDAFLAYLSAHPVLQNNPKPFIEEMLQDRDHLYIETDLIDDSHTYSALFAFIYENNRWKISRMETKAEKRLSSAPLAAKVDLHQIMVGQDIDDNGMIHDDQTVLTKTYDPIHVSVLLTASSPHAKVELRLSHEETNSGTHPVTGEMDNEGNNILSFTFTPPPEGWPDGHYRATVATDANEILESPFLFEGKEEPQEETPEEIPLNAE